MNTSPQIVDVSRDVVHLSTHKTTKARGKFQLHLVPRRNYMNLVFPNDVVNIYIDPGDGKRGFVRTMMGYVDRVEVTGTVTPDGGAMTRYVIIGSDFQKAIDMTSIYFNEYMRMILDERFVGHEKGKPRPRFSAGATGVALRSAGITLFGSPADFIENFLLIILGFGQQWRMPTTYGNISSNLRNLRERRVQRAKNRLPTNLKKLVADFGFDPTRIEENLKKLLEEARSTSFDDDDGLISAEDVTKRMRAAEKLRNDSNLLALSTLVNVANDPSFPAGLHDLLNYDFIETLAVDGFNANASVAQTNNETLGQFLYGHSNEIVNELIFDLRPVSKGDAGLVDDSSYSKEADDLGINVNGTPKQPHTVAAVQYAPAVVFREYPFSVVDKIDLRGITFVPPKPSTDPEESAFGIGGTPGSTGGIVEFGPIFAQKPNVPGRHTYQYSESLHPSPDDFVVNAKPVKHIDVVCIDNSDVKQHQLGRSDEDVVNVFQMYARSAGNASAHYREQMGNFSPVVNQISVARHGLRNREVTTEFANYQSPKNKENSFPKRNLVRWSLLQDHWYQHNPEYLTGTIVLRGMPEIRVGYRLDWKERCESYYVESVAHTWEWTGEGPSALTTTVEVSRGQRNDPFPAYIPPVFFSDEGGTINPSSGNRSGNGRLAQYFLLRDLDATIKSTSRGDPTTYEGPNLVDQRPFIGSDAVLSDGQTTAVTEEPENVG